MEKRCFACMNLTDQAICPHCGHDNANPGTGQEQFLRPGTIVGGRYYIGIPIDRNGEGITYIAYDNQLQLRVRVREFFPGSLCRRNSARKNVVVNAGSEIQFKALMTDFVELSRQLISLKSTNSLLHAKDILSDNNTIYVIYEDVAAVTLNQYLKNNAGELSWEETEALFLPLLYTVKLLNSNGIIHRGISPDTILVTEDHELKLKGVCTSAVRAINTEIKPELFSGYAAPEQYEKCASHGEWTDVYAICAVLYKTLTGSMPPRADLRGLDADLIGPAQLNPAIPSTVSDAIMRGLECRRADRTAYIKDLIGDLYATAPAPETPRRLVEEEEDQPVRRSKKIRFRMPVWLLVILITLPLMLILFFLIYSYVLGPSDPLPPVSSETPSTLSSELVSSEESSQPDSSEEEETSSKAPQIAVKNFVGQNYDDIINSAFYQNLYTFKEKLEVFDPYTPVGEIVKQDIEPDTIADQGVEIQLTVSKGPQIVSIVPTTDSNGNYIPLADYVKHYTDQGIDVTTETIESYDTPDGEIVRVDPPVGSTLDREKSNSIMVYIAQSPSDIGLDE